MVGFARYTGVKLTGLDESDSIYSKKDSSFSDDLQFSGLHLPWVSQIDVGIISQTRKHWKETKFGK